MSENLDAWLNKNKVSNQPGHTPPTHGGQRHRPERPVHKHVPTQQQKHPHAPFPPGKKHSHRCFHGRKPHAQIQNPHGKTPHTHTPHSQPAHTQAPHKAPHTPSQQPAQGGGKGAAQKLFGRGTIHPPHARLRVIPLGGLDEVGKNMMVFEYGNDIVIVDMGFQFPEEEMLGVDYVIPDVSYLKGKEHRIRGVFITHAHLDHIGGIPYLIEKLGSPPIFATRLTLEFIKKRNLEFKLKKPPKLYEINSDSRIQAGVFKAGFFRVNHSIPDCVGVYFETPVGIVVHTGDFKFDFTPADGIQADVDKMGQLGERNVLALFSESTNARIPGHSTSELTICENIDKLIGEAQGRVIIASFSSLLGRIQHIINSADKYKRRVFVSGRSMETNIQIAKKLGYLKLPHGTELHRTKKGGRHGDNDALILTTGSQGEDISALTRMAHGEHAHVKIRKGDTVILSSQPIVGNERAISRVMNELCKLGARVISNQTVNVHISGHGKQEDLKMMINLIKPRYLVPIHGEYYMRTGHRELGISLGLKEEQILMLNNGFLMESDGKKAVVLDEKVQAGYVLVEGPEAQTHEGMQVLQDRLSMSHNGVIVIALKLKHKQLIGMPDVISRGFIFRKESQEILKDIGKKAKDAYNALIEKDKDAKYADVKNYLNSRISTYIHNITEKKPLILPIIIPL